MTTETPKEPIEVHNSAVENDALEADRSLQQPPVNSNEPEPLAEGETRLVPIGDGGRADIAARFKAKRVDKEKPVDATGDYTDPAQTYGTVAQTDEPEPQPDQQQEAEPPKKLTLKVRGDNREVDRDEAMRLAKLITPDDLSGLSDDAITRLAQIGAAGESYLNDTRQVLETTRVQVSRHHPDATPPASTAAETDDNDDGTTTADPVKEIVQEIQYGDPDQAAAKLRTTMQSVAADAVKQAQSSDRVQQDIQNDLRAHDDFVKKHADLAADPIATAVIREGLMDGYREDLRKIGVPEERIPTDPSQLATHHRHYKLEGRPVRTVEKLLEASAERLAQWRGGSGRTEPTPEPKPERQVQVNVNRNERREAIPQQPTRSTVQPQTPANANTGQTSRSAAVQRAKAARGQA